MGVLADGDSFTAAQLGGDPPVALVMRGPVQGRLARVFPTDALQKGLVVRRGSAELTGEGMGFALPVVVHKERVIFPGRVEIETDPDEPQSFEPVVVTARYDLCMRQVLYIGGSRRVENDSVYRVRERLSRPEGRGGLAYRVRTWLARTLTAAGRFGLDYEEHGSAGVVPVRMTIDPLDARVDVEVSLDELDLPGATVSLLNELDGRLFDRYGDSTGIELDREAIGIWDAVEARQAWLGAPSLGLGFGIDRVRDAQVFRGRETSDPTLAWSGIACVGVVSEKATPPIRYSVWLDGPGLAAA